MANAEEWELVKMLSRYAQESGYWYGLLEAAVLALSIGQAKAQEEARQRILIAMEQGRKKYGGKEAD